MILGAWDVFAEKVENIIFQGIRILESGLGITLKEMLVQLCATLILFLVVRFLVWNKVSEILEKRKSLVSEALKEKDDALKEKEIISQENANSIIKAKQEAKEIIEKAKKKGYEEAEEITKNATLQAKVKVENAEAEIKQMVNESQTKIKEEIVDVAYKMASTIVNKEISEGKYEINVDDFIEKDKND